MLNGIYVATSGMLMQEKIVNSISNNLANAHTNGYKKDGYTFKNYVIKSEKYPENIIRGSLYNKTINRVVQIDKNYLDFSAGAIHQTGNKLDIALNDPNSFLTVETSFGIRFTRDGALSLNNNNELVTSSGYRVLSNNNQPITINGDVTFLTNGEVLINGVQIDQLAIATFDDMEKLQKSGRNLFNAIDILPRKSENPLLMQGYIEGSNVNVVKEMVRMIEANRGFETYQRVIATIDQLNDKASNELGRIA